jgi:serine protease inhibitor
MRRSKSFLSLCAVLAAMGHANAGPADEPVAIGDNAFGFRLINQLSKKDPAANICISPFSTATLLHMIDSGASGNTKTEIQQVLGTTGLSSSDVDAANYDVAQSLTRTSAHFILTAANAIWYRPGARVDPRFIATNRQFYGATVDALDFYAPHAVNIINTWANNMTDGKIPSIVDGIIDPRNTQLLLANAIYFKGKWLSPFEAQYTRNRLFHLHDGRDKTIAMMQQSKHWEY